MSVSGGPSKLADYVYCLTRVVVGFLFACHGAQKLFGVLGAQGGPKTPLILAAGGIEFFGGVLFAVGFVTRAVAFLMSGEMAVGYFMAHAPQDFWPILNRGELAVLYCFFFLYAAARSAGPWSVDAVLRRRSKAA